MATGNRAPLVVRERRAWGSPVALPSCAKPQEARAALSGTLLGRRRGPGRGEGVQQASGTSDVAEERAVIRSPVARMLGEGAVPVWSMSSAERLHRSLHRVGVGEIAPWPGGPTPDRDHLLLRADHLYDVSLVAGLAAGDEAVLLCPITGLPVAARVGAERAGEVAEALLCGAKAEDPAFAGLRAGGPGELGEAHNKALRKREVPFLLPLNAETVRAAEWRMFQGSYKGVTDAVTKHLWPVPAFHVTRWCAAVGITPNPVTWVSLGLVFLAMWLFWEAHFLTGLVAAWLMTFLDTVDGKLARVTLNSSKFGDVLDHGTDLIHPPFWYWAWMAGLERVGMTVPEAWWVLAVVLGGYVLQRIEEGLFLARFGIEMHVWRPFDSWFRLVTARRNPNLAILTGFALFGRPDWGILAVAAWTLISLVVHTVQVAQAFAASRHESPIRSWLATVRP